MKRLNLLLTLVLLLTVAFMVSHEQRGVRELVSYIEDCTLADAHAGRCTIPCSTDADCVAKNGTRDAY